MAVLFGLFFFVSIGAWIVGGAMARKSETNSTGVRLRRWARVGVVIFLILWVLGMSFRVVPAGHRGVVFNRITGVQDKVLGEGLNFVVPFISYVESVNVRTNKLALDLEAVTSDLQQMKFEIVVNYRPISDNVSRLFKEVGMSYVDVVLTPALNEIAKANTARYKAEEILSQRQEIKTLIKEELARGMTRYHILIDDVSLSNVRFSTEFEEAIEEKQVAEQLAKKKQYELEMAQRDAEIAQTKAKGEAEALKIRMLAEAEANRALDSSLTERILKYRVQMAYIERISDKIQIMVVPNNAVPLMNLQELFNK